MPQKKSGESTTVKRVREALWERMSVESITDIAKGAQVPYGWLQQFSYGAIIDPGFSRVERLATYLKITLES